MYNYSDLARAQMFAAAAIADCKSLSYDLSKEYSYNADFMYDISVVDKLEESWQHGRYLSFICNLRSLYAGLIKFFKTSAHHKLNDFNALAKIKNIIGATIIHEETLFEYMSSRGDASFCVNRDLYKLTYALRKGLSDDDDASEMRELILRFQTEREKYTFKDIGLLSIMATYIELADWLTEIEKSEDTPTTRELHAVLEDAGVYDRWRNF